MSVVAASSGRRSWRSALGWSAVVLAFVGLLAAAFFSLFERVREVREVGYRGEAARNPLLAAERLLGRLDVPAGRESDPRALPPQGHVLLALGAHHPPGTAYLDQLLAWVEAGGHLIVVPASGAFGDTAVEPLLAAVEVEVEWPAPANGGEDDAEGEGGEGDGGEEESGEGGESGEMADESADDEERGPPTAGEATEADEPAADEPAEADAAPAEREAATDPDAVVPPPPAIDLSAAPGFPVRRVSMPRWPVLHHFGWEKPRHLSGRPEGASLIAVARGAGRVTVLADASFLENDLLGRHDHARFAWDLVAAAGRPAGLAVVDWRRALPLSTLLARRGWPLAVAGALLLAAWIAWRGARFGPPLPDEAPPRRSLLEHLRASGEYLWRRGESGVLLAACRAAVARRLDLAHADWARRPEGDRVRRLARLSGVPAGTVAAALDGDAADAADFVRTVATLERLRRSS